uniref:DUF4378 domain-containing protein n=1 Tax=Leersia perrieri TaxID=77586 RepID=A0A0D9W0X0_9ORYZ
MYHPNPKKNIFLDICDIFQDESKYIIEKYLYSEIKAALEVKLISPFVRSTDYQIAAVILIETVKIDDSDRDPGPPTPRSLLFAPPLYSSSVVTSHPTRDSTGKRIFISIDLPIGHQYKECRPRRNSSSPTKVLAGKDLPKELEHRRSSPNVIAKLMGIDVLPPAYVAHNRHQEFKDVFEVSEEPQVAVTKERSHHFPEGLPSLRRSAFKLRKLMPSKSPYGDETFDRNVVYLDGFYRLNSLEINNPLFEKRPYDGNYSPNHQYEKYTSSTFRKYPVGLGNSSLKDIRKSSRGRHVDFNSIVVLDPGSGKVQDSGNAFSTPELSHVNKNFRREVKQADFSMINRGKGSQNLLDTEDVNMCRIKGERYLTSNAVDSLLKGQESSFDQFSTVDTDGIGSSQRCVSSEVNSRQSNRSSSNSSPWKIHRKYEEGAVGSKTLAEMFALSDSERLKRDSDSHVQIQDNKLNRGNSNGNEGCFIVLPKHAPRLLPHSLLDKNSSCERSPHSNFLSNTSSSYNSGRFHFDSFLDKTRRQQIASPTQDDLRNASGAKHHTSEKHSSASACHASSFHCHVYETTTISDHMYAAKSCKSLKDVEQPSPVSILEPPTDEDSCCSRNFKNDSQDMPSVERVIDGCEVRYEQEVSLSSDDDSDSSYQSLESFQVEEEWEFSYLLDMLISSGVIVADLQFLFKTWHLPGYPVGPHVFNRLERKYSKIATWPRSERRLLFDLANSVLSEILAPCINMHPWGKFSRKCCPVWGPEGPVEVVWQTIVRQREELAIGNFDVVVLDLEWVEIGEDINMVGRHIAKMLHGDLLDEIILEFLLGCV